MSAAVLSSDLPPAELLADHQAKPRNIGKLMNANATGDVGSIVVGDALRFYIQVKDERITAAKFQVFNCQDQMAASSVLTELAIGRTLDEAEALGPADLCAYLGGLDHTLLPPRLWALTGLHAAVAAYKGGELDADVELDPLTCRCHGIPTDTIRQSIKVMGLTTVEQVVDATGAGAGCGSCKADLPALLADATKPVPAATAAGSAKPKAAGRLGMVTRINHAVDDQLRPTLREAGVELELRDLDGAQVVVQLRGPTGAALSDDARRNALGTLEKLLKEQVDPLLTVREV